jgi:hypothetical protein
LFTDKLKEIVSEIPESTTIGRCILAWFLNIGLKKNAHIPDSITAGKIL